MPKRSRLCVAFSVLCLSNFCHPFTAFPHVTGRQNLFGGTSFFGVSKSASANEYSSHMHGFNDPDHQLSMLQNITKQRHLDVERAKEETTDTGSHLKDAIYSIHKGEDTMNGRTRPV